MTKSPNKRVRSLSAGNDSSRSSVGDATFPSLKRPCLAISKPIPVVTLNNADHQFVRKTVHERLPSIIATVIERNRDLWKQAGRAHCAMACMRLEELRQELSNERHGGNVEIKRLDDVPENSVWNMEYLANLKVVLLSDTSTFFLENYFYRRVLDAVQYWDKLVDPFAGQKRDMLASARCAFKRIYSSLGVDLNCVQKSERKCLGTASTLKKPLFRSILHFQLWGNRCDLSLSGGKVSASEEEHKNSEIDQKRETKEMENVSDSVDIAQDPHHPKDDDDKDQVCMLVDHTDAIWDDLVHACFRLNSEDDAKVHGGTVIIVLDNCGLELLSDLVCVAIFLTHHVFEHVELHCKSTPVFVSDVMLENFEATLVWLEAGNEADWAELASVLRFHLASKRLQIIADDFYTSPLSYAALPKTLLNKFQAAELVMIKGDANYRRLLGEKQWPIDTLFQSAVSYFQGVNLVALRTLKWPLAVGLSHSAIAKAEKEVGHEWDINGRCGTIQYASLK